MSANRIALDGTPRFAASHLGLFCLPMSHKKDASLIWVNTFYSVLALCSLVLKICKKKKIPKLSPTTGASPILNFAIPIQIYKHINKHLMGTQNSSRCHFFCLTEKGWGMAKCRIGLAPVGPTKDKYHV